MSDAAYAFGDLPLEPVAPGTTVLVTGPVRSGARELALDLVLAGEDHDEGMVLMFPAATGRVLLDQCEKLRPGVSESSLRVVDRPWGSAPDGDGDEPLGRVSTPADLTEAGMTFSSLVDGFAERGVDRVRTGVLSTTGVVSSHGFRTAARFVNILSGRVEADRGLGVVALDTDAVSEEAVDALARHCDGRVEVRNPAEQYQELRVTGLADQPSGWRRFRTDVLWPRGVGEHFVGQQVAREGTRYYCLKCGFSERDGLSIEGLSDVRCR